MAKTINNLLDVAIQHEILSQNMYIDAEKLVKDPEAKHFLNQLIEEEKEHQSMLESIKEMEIFDGSVPLEDETILYSGESSYNVKSDFTPDSTIEDILNVALKREFRAMNLFLNLAKTSTHSELKMIFEKLAKEEEIHHKNISKKFDIQKGKLGYEM